MATFFFFGNYSQDSLKNIDAGRTEKVIELIKNAGGEVTSIYALLGANDLVLIVELPDIKQAMAVSVALFKLTGISFSTSPAVEVAEFDKLVSQA